MAYKITKKIYIYEQLKQAIISGIIKPGEILNESDLAQKYNIGKTPTREALLLLTHEKLLDSMPRLGYVVSRLTTRDLMEIYALRIILETEAIGLAAERITPEEISLLEENNRKEDLLFAESSSGMVSEAYALNIEFHKIIAHAADNNRLERLISDLINDLERALSFDPYIADPDQHKELIHCIKAHDKVRAREAMSTHLKETKLRILKSF